MNWDKAWLTTKVTLFVVVDMLLLFASVVAAVFVGSLAMLLLDGGAIGMLVGLPVCTAIYFACSAGRNLAMATTVSSLFFNPDERAAIRSVAEDEERKK